MKGFKTGEGTIRGAWQQRGRWHPGGGVQNQGNKEQHSPGESPGEACVRATVGEDEGQPGGHGSLCVSLWSGTACYSV